MDTIWDLYATLTRRLLWWSAASILIGVPLLLLGGPFWQAFGVQAAAWGAIDAMIALLGQRTAKRRKLGYADPLAGDVGDDEGRKLRRLLWINAGLDVLYVAGGLVLTLTLGRSNTNWRGHGWGIAVQGAFLLVFDWIHAQSVPATLPRDLARLYAGDVHTPFSDRRPKCAHWPNPYTKRGGRSGACCSPDTARTSTSCPNATTRTGWRPSSRRWKRCRDNIHLSY
jgi:hypothetical protein